MPAKLATFPKCFLDHLVVDHTMTWAEWIDLAAELPHVEGLEGYAPAFESFEPAYLRGLRQRAEDKGLSHPMMCVSPDFTKPDATERKLEVENYLRVLDAVKELGGGTCRVLSGQRRPEVFRADGIAWTVECIQAALPHAAELEVIMVMENHYKDGYWQYPEFAQAGDIYLEIINQVHSPWFGVNYDPSNALIAGEDAYDLLDKVKHRVISMHASDRSLEGGSLEDLRKLDADPISGYASFVKHGVIGQGLIDYDRIFTALKGVGFEGWISIEDGQDPEVGMEHLRESSEFLWEKMGEYGLR